MWSDFFIYETKQIKTLSKNYHMHLYDVKWIGISNMEPNVNSVMEQRQAQISHEQGKFRLFLL
jgi:hypothetical protein